MKINGAVEKFMKGADAGIKYVGRTTDFRGQTLWECVANLRDLGIGRMVIRNMFQRYPEPCYMRILDVEAVPHEEVRRVRVTVEKTWRGVTLPKPVVIYSASYKADYAIVPKEEEAHYLKNTKKIDAKVLPSKIEFPPLLREFIKEETGVEEPLMDVHFRTTPNKFVRVAKAGEQPTLSATMGLGKPASENLYAGLI